MDIAPVPESEKPLLWDMLQSYIDELSVYAGIKPVNGVYDYPKFDLYWSEKNRWPFWAIANGERAGFALILRDGDAMRVGEFYIRPEFRRAKLGAEFALALVQRFPGPWKIRQMAANQPAVAFWRRTLAPYNYTEANFVDRDLERFEQTLVIPAS
jgi:predicted acetyltransferase